jgi:Cu2+-containing amine oxidase
MKINVDDVRVCRVGPYASGTFHQHMFSYKVDIDVLGTANTMRVMSLVPTTYDAPWFDVPQTRPLPVVHTVRNESESTFVPDYNAPMTYMFVNQGQKNAYTLPLRRARAAH